MRNYLLAGVAVASAFALMIPLAPASAQGGCGIGRPCGGGGQNHYRHNGYSHGYGRGDGLAIGAAALAAGVIVGGALQQNQDYGYGYPDQSYPAGPYSAYPAQGPLYDAGGALVSNDGDSVAYCQQTYRSYDPASGTYLGYDGLRHPCP
jgi:hypothetical protein